MNPRMRALLEGKEEIDREAGLVDPSSVADAVAEKKSEPTEAPAQNNLRLFLDQCLREENPFAFEQVNRIIGLPVIDGYSEEEREEVQREIVLADHYERGFRLFDLQCDALLAYRRHGCLFAPIGVGWGKTIITQLIASEAFRKGYSRTMLVIPPQLVTQFTKRDLPFARPRINLSGCPFHIVTGSPARRLNLAQSGKIGCYVIPSSMLSTANAEDVIAAIAPQTVIVDECQCLRNIRTSAAAKRTLRYVNEHHPDVAWLSGTITSKTVFDYLHLAIAMGDLSPLPTLVSTASEWADVIDSNAEPSDADTGPIRPLLEWAQRQDVVCSADGAGFRRAYKHRLLTNPAVVATGDQELGVSLTISHIRVSPEDASDNNGERLHQLQHDVNELWVAPNGDEIDHAFHKFRWLYELSAGFYNDLYWPDEETVSRKRRVSISEAEDLLKIAREHHEWRQEYHRELRAWLQSRHIQGLDTPFLVAGDLARHGSRNVGDSVYQRWRRMKAVEERAGGRLVERDGRVVRVCDYKVRYGKAWARENKHGVIWYYNQGIGEWLHELIPDAVFCPAGKKSDLILSDPEKTRGRLVIASIKAHSTGKNLQQHNKQVFIQWPRPADTCEQVLGRLHRNGQEADEITAHIASDLPMSRQGEATFDELLYAAALGDALYIHQTTGSKQKVIYAGYDPIPRIFPPAVLEERGFELQHRLREEHQSLLRESFRS